MDFEARELLRNRVLASPASRRSNGAGSWDKALWVGEQRISGMESTSGPSGNDFQEIYHLPHLDYLFFLERGDLPCILEGSSNVLKRASSHPAWGQVLLGLTGVA